MQFGIMEIKNSYVPQKLIQALKSAFLRELWQTFGKDVESSYRETFSTLSGGVIGYAHQVELETLGLRFQSYVYFAESHAVNRNLLGRQGWLQLITLGLNDYESTIYLKTNTE